MSVNTIWLSKQEADRRLVLCGQDKVFRFFGAGQWSDITGAPVADGVEARWSGGWLGGGLTLANQKVVRTYQEGVDSHLQKAVYNGGTEGPGDETWESKNYSAAVFRPFREYMLAANVRWDGENFASRVQWSHPVEPGYVPVDWVPRDTNQAGDVDLADTVGDIVDIQPYKDMMLVYKQDAIYSCQWVGGNSVFSFRRVTSNKGIIARDCVVEYNGRHWCQGVEDIFTVDANEPVSLLWGKMKKTWLADRDPDRCTNNWAALDPINEELLFAYVSKNAPAGYAYPDKMLVLSLRNNVFFLRDYECEVPHARVTLDVVDEASANLVFYAIDATNDRLLDLEAAYDRDGLPVPAFIERTGLFSDPGHDTVQVDRAKLQITGADAKLRLGEQLAIDATVQWRDQFDVVAATDYRTDVRANGMHVSYRVDLSALTDWQIANLSLLVQKTGERAS